MLNIGIEITKEDQKWFFIMNQKYGPSKIKNKHPTSTRVEGYQYKCIDYAGRCKIFVNENADKAWQVLINKTNKVQQEYHLARRGG